MNTEFRILEPDERRLIDHLLEGTFPGSDALREQINSCKALIIDENGSLKLRVTSDTKARTKSRIPTEGEAEDSDGVTIHVLLHVVDGKMHQLEIYKEDSSPVISLPLPQEFRLFRPA